MKSLLYSPNFYFSSLTFGPGDMVAVRQFILFFVQTFWLFGFSTRCPDLSFFVLKAQTEGT